MSNIKTIKGRITLLETEYRMKRNSQIAMNKTLGKLYTMRPDPKRSREKERLEKAIQKLGKELYKIKEELIELHKRITNG
jgi:hypothetical protein